MERIRRHVSFANVTSLCALFVALGGAAYAGINLPRNSVGSKQIKAKAVKAGEIKGKAVTVGKIAPDAVKASKIVDGSVGGGELADGGIGLVDLGPSSVDGTKVADGGLGLADLGANSVDGTKVVDGSLGLADLGPNSVDGAKVTDGTLGAADATPGAFLNGNVTVQFVQHGADLANGAEISIDVHCLAGQTAIGGGVRGDLTNSELTKVTASRPVIDTDNSGAPSSNGTFTGWRGTFVNENNGAGIRPEVWVICAGPTP
jgi:hypothetical protein